MVAVMTKSRGEGTMRHRMTRVCPASTARMEWSPLFGAEGLRNMEQTCTVWRAKWECILIPMVKNSVGHVLCVQRGGQLNVTALHRKIDYVARATMVTT